MKMRCYLNLGIWLLIACFGHDAKASTKGWVSYLTTFPHTKQKQARSQLIARWKARLARLGITKATFKRVSKGSVRVCISASMLSPPPQKPSLWQRFTRLYSTPRFHPTSKDIVKALVVVGKLELKDVIDDGKDAIAIHRALKARAPHQIQARQNTYRRQMRPSHGVDRYFHSRSLPSLRSWVKRENIWLAKTYKGRYKLTLSHKGLFQRGSWRTFLLRSKANMDRTHIANAKASLDPQVGMPEVRITLTSQGAKRFSAWTQRVQGRRIAIVYDGQVQSAPVVMTRISSGRLRLNLGATGTVQSMKRDAHVIATVLTLPSLPVRVTLAKVEAFKQANPAPCRSK